jgi:ribosome-binding factor A
MANYHIDRINDDIRRVLAERLRDVKDPRIQQGSMITVTHTDTTNDLRYCKVYLSVLGDYDAKEMKKGLKSVSGWLRRELGNSLNLRYTPELTFEMDDSIAHGAYINRLINDLEINHEEDHDSE